MVSLLHRQIGPFEDISQDISHVRYEIYENRVATGHLLLGFSVLEAIPCYGPSRPPAHGKMSGNVSLFQKLFIFKPSPLIFCIFLPPQKHVFTKFALPTPAKRRGPKLQFRHSVPLPASIWLTILSAEGC